MNPKTVLGFAVVTLIVLIAAGASIGARISGAPAATGKERLFPALAEKAAEVAEISVQTAAETLTAKRRGEVWVLAERQGFAVSEEVVRQLIIGLSELRLAEAKTARSKLYARLEVEDVTAKEAKSKLIRIKDESGEVMAELIIGKENAALAGPTGVGIYVRKPGEERAWLVQGAVQVPLEAKNWVAPEILNVTKQRVTRVSVVQPDGKTMVIKSGRRGRFLACSGYPDCKTSQPLPIGVPCPRPGCKGEMVERQSGRGKTFFSCSAYPECRFLVGEKPKKITCEGCGQEHFIGGKPSNPRMFGEPTPKCPYSPIYTGEKEDGASAKPRKKKKTAARKKSASKAK